MLLTEHHRAATLSGDPSGEGNELQLVAGAVAQALRPITPLHRVSHTRPGPGRTTTPPALSTSVFNVTHAHREIDHRVLLFIVPYLA